MGKEVPIGGGGKLSKRTASCTACVSSMPSKERSGYPQGRSMRDVSSGVGGKLTKRRSDTSSACVSCIRITKRKEVVSLTPSALGTCPVEVEESHQNQEGSPVPPA